MFHGFIGRPRDPDDLRSDIEQLLALLDASPDEKVFVTFGFAWGSEIYEGDWDELELTASELRHRIAAAEAAGMGRIGSDDLYIRVPRLGVEWQYCHHADVHVTANDAAHPYLAKVRREWLDRGWEVKSMGTARDIGNK